MPRRCSGCWPWWSVAAHVWCRAGDADLSGGGSHRHAQGFRGSLRLGARSVAVGAAERAHFPLLERAAKSVEAAVLGWPRAVGLRQTFGEGALSLASGGSRTEQGGAPPGGTGAADGRHRFGGQPTPGVVSER